MIHKSHKSRNHTKYKGIRFGILILVSKILNDVLYKPVCHREHPVEFRDGTGALPKSSVSPRTGWERAAGPLTFRMCTLTGLQYSVWLRQQTWRSLERQTWLRVQSPGEGAVEGPGESHSQYKSEAEEPEPQSSSPTWETQWTCFI